MVEAWSPPPPPFSPWASPGRGAGHALEHADLTDEGGGEAQGGAVFAREFEHFAAMVVAFFDRGKFDRHHLFDDGGIGAVDGELQAFFHEGIAGGFDGVFEGQDAVAAGGFGELDDLLNEVAGLDIFMEEAFFDVRGGWPGGMEGHRHDGQADGAAHDEQKTFGGEEGFELTFRAMVHGEDDAAGGEKEAYDRCDVLAWVRP